jgi:amino acid transporter
MGWLLYLVRLTAAATNANLFVIYLGEFWSAAGGVLAGALVLTLLIGALTAVNIRGVSGGAQLSSGFIVIKLLPLLLFVGVGLAWALGRPLAAGTVTASPGTWLEVVMLVIFAYGGFEAALMPLGEARNPQRDAPFALFVGLGTVTVIYLLVQVVVVAALADPGAETRPVAAAARVFIGPTGAGLMAMAALLSVSGYLAGAMVNVPRLTYAMAEQGDLPRPLGLVHPRFRTPWVSVLVFAALTWALALSGGFLQNLTLSAVSRLFTYGLVCAALPIFRRRDGTAAAVPAAAFRLPGGGLIAAAGILVSLILAARMNTREAVILLVVVSLAALHWWAAVRGRGGRRGEAPTPAS